MKRGGSFSAGPIQPFYYDLYLAHIERLALQDEKSDCEIPNLWKLARKVLKWGQNVITSN